MERRHLILLFVAVALFAIATRSFLYHWDKIFGIDSYWFARISKYVFEYGYPLIPDPLYSWSFEHYHYLKELTLYFPAWYYKLTGHTVFERELWLDVFKDLGVIFGTLGSVVAGLIGLALGGPVAGVLSGFFAATNPGYVYRTMAGFFEDDAPGLFFYLLGVYLIIEGLRRKEKKQRWAFFIGGAIAWLLEGMSWKAFHLVTYTFLLFAVFYVGRLIWDVIRERFTLKRHLHGALLTVALSFVFWLIWRTWALRTAIKTISITGFLSTNINYVGAAVLLALGTHPLVPVFMALFGYYMVLALRERDKKFLAYAVASFLLALPFIGFSASHGFATLVTLPDGRETYIGYGEAFKQIGGNVPGVDFYQMLFGSAMLIFLSQLIGSFTALLLDRKDIVDRKNWKDVALLFVALLVIPSLAYFFNGRTVLDPFLHNRFGVLEQRNTVIGFTVVEERYGYFFWSPKYSWLALIPLFIAPFVVVRTHRKEWILFLAFLTLTLYVGWIKLKFCYYFGPTVGIVAGLFFAEAWNHVKERERWKKAYPFFLLLMVLALLATGIFHTVGRIPTLLNDYEVNEAINLAPMASDTTWIRGPDYLGAFEFLDKNTDRNAPIFNWWGVGNWLTFFTEHPVATDPTNAIRQANEFVASMMLSDANTAYQKIKERNFEYVFWIRDYVYAADSFALYAYGYGGDFQRAREVASQYTFFLTQPCQKATVGNYYNCGTAQRPFWVDADIYEKAPPVFLAPLDYNALPKIRAGNTLYGVYRLNDRLVIVSEKMNESLMFTLWKGGNQHFVPVYVSPTGYITIYKIE